MMDKNKAGSGGPRGMWNHRGGQPTPQVTYPAPEIAGLTIKGLAEALVSLNKVGY